MYLLLNLLDCNGDHKLRQDASIHPPKKQSLQETCHVNPNRRSQEESEKQSLKKQENKKISVSVQTKRDLRL
jgi:hypothetical protein